MTIVDVPALVLPNVSLEEALKRLLKAEEKRAKWNAYQRKRFLKIRIEKAGCQTDEEYQQWIKDNKVGGRPRIYSQ